MKILMTLMGMEIGGAETHVAELCRELAARGHDVTVASNGGVYVAELERCGVKHVTLPLHSKSPSCLVRSYSGLERLIKREKFDLVHAHARIPAFVCGLLQRRLKFRFMTSTHGVYKVDSVLTRVTNWGERSVAVSCDVKQYLIDSYKFPSDNISITINGIDTERFSRAVDGSAQRAELGLADGKFRVVYVSRIDTEAALTGFLLCDAAEALADEIPELELLLVGGGTALDKLRARAEEVNRKVGRELLKLTGARTDVAALISTGDCFAGVSRAALEAMSLEKPIILAGAQGYIGVLTPENLALSQSTNFCCRGEKLPDAQLITDDIRRLHAMTHDERDELGRFGRNVILEGYSVARMCDDYLAAYARMRPFEAYKRGEIIVSGYYGFDNMGDDSLLAAMLDGIRKLRPDAKITVLSGNPRRTGELCGVRCINRFNLPAVAREMRGAKLLISGGGSLLQDGTSRKSLVYYVHIMRMAKKRGLKLMLLANGLGPLTSKLGKRLAAGIIADADYVSLREERSVELAGTLGADVERLKLSADPAFLIEPASDEWVAHIKRREQIGDDSFVVSVKDGNNFGERSSDELFESLAADIAQISEKYSLTPLFVPMHEGKDNKISERLCSLVGRGRVLSGLTAPELCGILRGCKFAVGMRLHTLIFAARMGCIPLGISYDPKIDALTEYLRLPKPLDVRTYKKGELVAALEAALESSSGLPERVEELRELARLDCATAVRLAFDV